MTRATKILWAKELRRLFRTDRYRVSVRMPSGAVVVPDLGEGPWNRNYCADPFLFAKDGQVWLFYETLDAHGKGILGCLREEGGGWKQEGLILEEKFHLSYPQVFEEAGRIYMLPETTGAGAVILYEAIDFPRRWRPVARLIERKLADATLLKRDGTWYLAGLEITTKKPELWTATGLMGPWERHPESGNMNASSRLRRCGGAFVEDDGRLWRIAQDCHGTYGRRLWRIPVEELSPAHYREGWAELFQMDNWPPPADKRHTYNRLETLDGTYEVIDRLDHPVKGFWACVAGAFSLLAHQLFRIRHKGGGLLVQVLGVQYRRGTVRAQPALVTFKGKD